jgi:hypothetical protein
MSKFRVPRRLLWVNGAFKGLVVNSLLQGGSVGLLPLPLERLRNRLTVPLDKVIIMPINIDLNAITNPSLCRRAIATIHKGVNP